MSSLETKSRYLQNKNLDKEIENSKIKFLDLSQNRINKAGFLEICKNNTIENLELFESVGIFWHTCDILWILIFSTFYMGG